MGATKYLKLLKRWRINRRRYNRVRLYVCVCVWVYIYIYICSFVYVFLRLSVCMYTYIWTYVCIRYMCVRACVRTRLRARVLLVKDNVLLIISFIGILICFLNTWSRCRLNLNWSIRYTSHRCSIDNSVFLMKPTSLQLTKARTEWLISAWIRVTVAALYVWISCMFLASLRCAKIRFNTIINPAFHAQNWRHPKKGSVRLNTCHIHKRMLTKKCFVAKETQVELYSLSFEEKCLFRWLWRLICNFVTYLTC
jgi:hypothetical protein